MNDTSIAQNQDEVAAAEPEKETAAAQLQPAKPSGKIKMGDRDYDLERAFPLTLGDWKQLDKLGLLGEDGDLRKLLGPGGVSTLLTFFFKKVEPSVEENLVDTLPVKKIMTLFRFCQSKLNEEEEDLDPTKGASSTSSTSSV